MSVIKIHENKHQEFKSGYARAMARAEAMESIDSNISISVIERQAIKFINIAESLMTESAIEFANGYIAAALYIKRNEFGIKGVINEKRNNILQFNPKQSNFN